MNHVLRRALPALLLSAAAGTATAAAPDLFISEYIEGSSFNKAIELHNATGASIDLAAGGYRLELYSNGAATASASIALTGTLASGDVLVLCHASAGAAIQAQCDVRNSAVINFNGDDAVVLRKGGAVIDAVGQVGNDPGSEWEATADNTLQRKPGFCGDTNAGDAFAPSLEWNVFGIDTFDGLGSHAATCDGGEPPPVATAMTIAQIQGSGDVSAHADALVETEGVVTALKFNNGFFLQSLAPDADPATSEAVFVFTSAAPTVAVGDQVKVVATVKEFVPGSNLNQLPITELVSPRVEVLARGVALPAPVELTQAELNAGSLPGTLERLEGMRVSVAEARVVEASDGSIDENDATSRTGGVFQVVLPQTARPFREPGIGVMDVIPVPAGKTPPRFDTNQERLMVRSWGQVGSQPLAVDVDAVVTGLVGVLDYNTGTWALTPDTTAVIGVSGGKSPVAVTEAGGTELTIGSFNLLRFFDDVADGNGAVKLTTEAMNARLAKTSAAICDWLKAPDILGVVEVENLNILGKLATRLNETCARAPGYTPYLVQGNDVGGINVGFLVSTRDNGAGAPRVSVGDVVQYGKDATLANPDGSTSLLNDRPPLLLHATVHNANGASYPVTVIANHLRSLGDIDSTAAGSSGWATSGDRVRGKRAAQAAYLAGLVHSLQESRPDDKLVLVGDFNAFEFNDGYVDVMGIVRGQPAAEDQVLTWAPSPIASPLVDGSELIADPAERYSYVFAGNAQTLDHVLVNEALLLNAANARVEHARINADFGVHHFGEAGNALRVSDHDPVRLAIEPPQFRDADLSVTLAGPAKKLHYGRTERFALQVANTGPHAAWRPVLVLRGDAPMGNVVAVSAPQGWTCASNDAAGDFELRCQAEQELAAGATAAFAADILVPARPDATEFLTLDAVVGAGSSDPSLGNNNAQYRNRIVGVP